MATYHVETVQPDIYIDKGGKPVRGYMVRVTLLDFGEIHDLQVPTTDPKIVKAAIEKLIENRQALAELGE